MMLNWSHIHTVLLDMDGTLLDLHFDNHFWLVHLPALYAKQNHMTLDAAKQLMHQEYTKVHGTLNWYCLDYWTDKLQLDIRRAKREIQHLISMRDDTVPFLDALKQSGRDVILLTNAHPDSLSLKVEHTQLDRHIDKLVSTHQFGASKESQVLWQRLHDELKFDPLYTLMVDDNVPILDAALAFGIGQVLAISNPDSQQPHNQIERLPATADYNELIPTLLATPFSV